MAKSDFTVIVKVDRPSSEVFAAINNVRGWWQGEFKGNTTSLGDEFVYRMEGFHLSTQKIVELVPDKRVVWLVTKSKLTFTQQQDEWTGTRMVFDIEEKNGSTTIKFTHEGLVSAFECYKDCSNAWSLLIKESLVSLITTGKGKKVFG